MRDLVAADLFCGAHPSKYLAGLIKISDDASGACKNGDCGLSERGGSCCLGRKRKKST
jgi:hypothetical protein